MSDKNSNNTSHFPEDPHLRISDDENYLMNQLDSGKFRFKDFLIAGILFLTTFLMVSFSIYIIIVKYL